MVVIGRPVADHDLIENRLSLAAAAVAAVTMAPTYPRYLQHEQTPHNLLSGDLVRVSG